MSYPINQKVNPYIQQQQTVMGMNTELSANNSVAMGLDAPNMDTIIDNSALRGIKDDEYDKLISLRTLLLSIPVTAGFVYGMDRFNAACGGKYETSLVGRINAYGEKLGKKAPYLDTFFNKIDGFINWFKTKVAPKTSITSSFFLNHSVPESPMVSTMAIGTHAEIASEAIGKLEKYVSEGGVLAPGSATKEEILKLADKNTRRTEENVRRIMEICQKQGDAFLKVENFGNIKSIPLIRRLFKKDRYLSNLLPKSWKDALTRELHFSEFANKIKAIIEPGTTTAVGKRLSKFTLRFVESLTNGTAGGKGAMFLGAYFIADAIKKAIYAPKKKGEKRKVLAENLISNVGMYMTMPLSIILMHSFGGLEYLGMGKGDVQTKNLKEYRDRLAQLKTDVEARTITKAAHKIEAKQIDDIRFRAFKFEQGDKIATKALKVLKYIVYRPIMGITSLLKVGLERTMPHTAENNVVVRALKKGWYYFKGGAGYPVRMGIFMFVIAKFFNDILAKGSHKIFGRPERSILDVGKEPEQTNQYPQPIGIPQEVHQSQPLSVIQPVQQNSNLNNIQADSFQRQNLLNTYKAKSENRSVESTPQKPVRKYIPSSDGVKIDQNANRKENDKANAVIDKSYIAEKAAMKYVH